MIKQKKGQTGIEVLVLLAVAVLVIGMGVVAYQNQTNNVIKLKDQNQAATSVTDLGTAAKEVYAQGIGAKKLVYVNLPNSYQPQNSYIANQTIRVVASGSDYVAKENFDIHGTLPSISGPSWILLVSEGNKVRIGTAMLDMSPNSFYLTLNKNTTRSSNVQLESFWNSSINLTSVTLWGNGNFVTLTDSLNTSSLDPMANASMTIGISAANNASGLYSGEISVTGKDSQGNSETLNLPITIEVTGFGVNNAPALTVTPSLWNDTATVSSIINKSFTVCAGGSASFTSVSFSPSSGPPGSWITNNSAVQNLLAGTCQQTMLSMNIPTNTVGGNYPGTILVSGAGNASATDNIALSISVGNSTTDITGPSIFSTNISKTYSNAPLTINIWAADSNDNVNSCKISFDNSSQWYSMSPADGDFNSPNESASYTYVNGFALGTHNASIYCIDSNANIGPQKTVQFSIMKNFLFITKTGGPKNFEQDWMNWLSTHTSGLGYNWNYDSASSSTVENGGINLTYYSAVVFADYQFNDATLVSTVQTYENQGGSVIFVGKGLHQGPRDFGFTSYPAFPAAGESIYITSNSTYLLWGFAQNQSVNISSSQSIESIKSDFSGTTLAQSDSTKSFTVLGTKQNYYIWGPRATSDMNANGNLISTRVFDLALNQSSVTPSGGENDE